MRLFGNRVFLKLQVFLLSIGKNRCLPLLFYNNSQLLMKLVSRFIDFSSRVQNVTVIRAIRNGLVNMIPILIIGAFALVFKSFPVAAYQTFIADFWGGAILKFFDFVYTATFGVLSVYMTFSISRAYARLKTDQIIVNGGAILSSLLAFFMLSGSFLPTFSLDNMGPKSMLVAIIAGLGASSLYLLFFRLLSSRSRRILSIGADHDFNRMLSTLFPILFTALSFALINLLVVKIFNVDSFRELYIKAMNALFSVGETGFGKGFAFVLLSSLLWFFGVHGSDALEGVMQTYFAPGLEANQAAIAAGGTASTILTKEFFDCFVLLGGCGATICLLLAILIFSRNRARRGLGFTAAPSMIFNINELMVFGLPIIFNPIMLIPFLLVPLVCYSISYAAMAWGWVPLISNSVEWTTPIFLGGYFSTGSVAGIILQVALVLIGVAIYFPFVRILDRQSERVLQNNFDEFVHFYMENERELQNVKIGELNNVYGSFAKELAADIRHDLLKNLVLHYQPQYNYQNQCIGVEALLRFHHPVLGNLYPPLVVKLVSENGLMEKLDEGIVRQILKDRPALLEQYGQDIKISFNATGTSVSSGSLLALLRQIQKQEDLSNMNLCVELTEQEAFAVNDKTREILMDLKAMGLKLAIDDFSMGQTSLHYLKENIFDVIKIDGSLVKGLSTSQNCREIVSSLVELAESLNLSVIAEFVETEEDKELLHQMGCDIYQGYLYSPAKPVEQPKVALAN